MCLIFYLSKWTWFHWCLVLSVVVYLSFVNKTNCIDEWTRLMICFSQDQSDELLWLFVISIRFSAEHQILLHHGWHTNIQRCRFISRMQVLWINTELNHYFNDSKWESPSCFLRLYIFKIKCYLNKKSIKPPHEVLFDEILNLWLSS